MKKILSLLFLVAFVATAFSQERTWNLAGTGNLVDLTLTKNIAWDGNTYDRLIPTTRDTIDYYVILKNYGSGPLHFYATFTFDTIAGADTTIAITVQEKKFANESYTDVIASALTSAISAETKVVKTSLGVISEYTETHSIASHNLAFPAYTIKQDTAGFKYYPADSLKIPAVTAVEAAQTVTVTKTANTLLHYRYLKFRLILQGNDSVGTGIKVKRVELQFFQ